MANKRIQDLEQTTDLTNDDLIPLDTTKKTFATTLKSLTEWLKNTFQTKDNLEQALSDATDKYPSSKVLKDESSRIVSVMDTKANDSDVIHKSGDETITGRKVFYNSDVEIRRDDGAYPNILLNNSGKGWVVLSTDARGRLEILNGDWKNLAPIVCGGSTDDNSVVTTALHGANWLRFGNGLQICWGVGGAGTVTLPVPFVNTNYQVTTSQVGGGHTYNCGTDNYTTTSFNIASYQAHWIALGYWY